MNNTPKTIHIRKIENGKRIAVSEYVAACRQNIVVPFHLKSSPAASPSYVYGVSTLKAMISRYQVKHDGRAIVACLHTNDQDTLNLINELGIKQG